jgi:hypothetical protein
VADAHNTIAVLVVGTGGESCGENTPRKPSGHDPWVTRAAIVASTEATMWPSLNSSVLRSLVIRG